MGFDAVSYALSKKYTEESLQGLGALKGKNCTISSITPIDGGNEVTFSYTLDDGIVQTSTMVVENGQDGEDGNSITSMTIDTDGNLICTMSDGSIQNAGKIPVVTTEVEVIIKEEVTEQIETQLQETIKESVDKAIEDAFSGEGSGGSDIEDEIDSWF